MRIDSGFSREVEERSGQKINLCYQCLKCFAGCPVSRYMDYKPNGVIRLVQYGEREKVLKSHAIWLCVSCKTCGVRCPNGVDMSQVMDTLREMSWKAGLAYEAEKRVVILHEEFVRSIKLWGRLHEMSFFVPYMLRSRDFFTNMASAPKLMLRRKLPLLPTRIKGIAEVRKVFAGTHEAGGEQEKGEGQ